jgi:zinc transporter ZupT
VTDLWLLALGFGVLPFLAVVLYASPDLLRRRESALWGLLAGVVAFLGVTHAGLTLIEGNAFLRYETNPWSAALIAAAGLLAGIALGWRLLGRASTASGSLGDGIVWAAAAFIAVHSFTDGLVLGEAYAGPGASGFDLTLAAVGGTVLHRFAEGSLIVVPALLASWRPPRTFALLLAGIVTLPAAYVPGLILGSGTLSAGLLALDQAVGVFGAGLEAGFALLFLALGLLPRAQAAKDSRWAVWAGVAFTLMLLVHFVVE